MILSAAQEFRPDLVEKFYNCGTVSHMSKEISMPNYLLRVEGLTVFVASIFFYFWLKAPVWIFVVLFLAPDLSMLGFILNKHVGSIIYNIFHTYTLPLIMAFFAIIFGNDLWLHIALIWFGHIGMDRVLGYGLKYKTGFKDTHFQRV